MESHSQNSKIIFTGTQAFGLMAALGMSAFLTLVFTKLLFHNIFIFEIALGWVLAAGFNLIGLAIRLSAIGKDIRQFFFYSLILGALNAAIFLFLICFIVWKMEFHSEIFVSAIFIAYFSLLFYDLWQLKSSNAGPTPVV